MIVQMLVLTDEFSEKEKGAALGLRAERIVSEGQAASETAGASSQCRACSTSSQGSASLIAAVWKGNNGSFWSWSHKNRKSVTFVCVPSAKHKTSVTNLLSEVAAKASPDLSPHRCYRKAC